MNRKLDLLVDELERYGIAVAGIQEAKWFGSDVWPAAKGYMLLYSGRPTPDVLTGRISRGEGVGIVLNKKATAAWRAGGEEWRAVSSRLVMARLKWKNESRRRSKESFLTIICVYAPTARAHASVKSRFAEQLKDALDGVPNTDSLVLAGDFNTRVGLFNPDDDLWHGVVGKYGIEERNLAGEDFLQFCECNQLSITNTWYQKKPIHYGIWMYPATKLHHMTDFVVMTFGQTMCCLDIQVMRGANCWMDHGMVRAKLRLLLLQNSGVQRRPLPFSVQKS